jgi:hypothetical protein
LILPNTNKQGFDHKHSVERRVRAQRAGRRPEDTANLMPHTATVSTQIVCTYGRVLAGRLLVLAATDSFPAAIHSGLKIDSMNFLFALRERVVCPNQWTSISVSFWWKALTCARPQLSGSAAVAPVKTATNVSMYAGQDDQTGRCDWCVCLEPIWKSLFGSCLSVWTWRGAPSTASGSAGTPAWPPPGNVTGNCSCTSPACSR